MDNPKYNHLSVRAKILLEVAIFEYSACTDKQKKELVTLVENRITGYMPMQCWGGMDEDTLIACKEFIGFLKNDD